MRKVKQRQLGGGQGAIWIKALVPFLHSYHHYYYYYYYYYYFTTTATTHLTKVQDSC